MISIPKAIAALKSMLEKKPAKKPEADKPITKAPQRRTDDWN